jgi:hypothetical protein
MVLIGYIPFVHAAGTTALFILAATHSTRLFLPLAFASLYLLPPLIVRLFTLITPLPAGKFPVHSATFLKWWFTAQWQILFNRLRILEELLRLVPGLYSTWLRLWGARIGRLVYWTPGLEILDRPLLNIGRQVAFGAGVRLNSHVVWPDPETREMKLVLAPITLGDHCVIGGYSVILAGTVVGPNEHTPAMRPLLPFTHFKDNRRHETQGDDRDE